MLKPILVGGEWRRGRGEVYASRYPADDSVNAELAAASVADVEEAIRIADAAWRRPDWHDLKPHERAGVLYRISALIRARAEELAQLQRRDNGKPIGETRALVASAAGTFQFCAGACETLEETLTPPRGDYLTMSIHEPLASSQQSRPGTRRSRAKRRNSLRLSRRATPSSSSPLKSRRFSRSSSVGSVGKQACRKASSA
jgi:hypothetical protein